MSKASASNGDRDEMIHSELSHDGYVTADDMVALPNYLVHLPSHNDITVEINVEEELTKKGEWWRFG